MNLTLIHKSKSIDGIFGESLIADSKKHFCMTLEHAYADIDEPTGYRGKIPPGVYKCVRGTHKLHDGIPFETFEVKDVPDCTGILFHPGNYNSDSEGCILIGMGIDNKMLTRSKQCFEDFMNIQNDVEDFILTVEG